MTQHFSPVAFAVKVALRVCAVEAAGSDPVVLDAFSGDGDVWRAVDEELGVPVRRVRIEKDRSRVRSAATLVGDNRKFLPAFDLAAFDVVDLDSWGIPDWQFESVVGFDGPIVWTCCRPKPLSTSFRLALARGIPAEWLAHAKSLFVDDLWGEWSAFLASCGVSDCWFVQLKSTHLYGICNADVDVSRYNEIVRRVSRGN